MTQTGKVNAKSVKIIIDADACPQTVLSVCIAIGKQRDIEVITVANFNHVIQSPRHIVVGDNSQEADMMIANITKPGDVVVTQDWGLVALIVGKGASCLSPSGREYHPGTIDFLLEERAVKAKLRRSGNRTKGPKKRIADEDNHFVRQLKRIISQ